MDNCPNPAVAIDDVGRIAKSLFGLTLAGDPRKMHSTTDDVFLLQADRRYVLRIGMMSETRENASFQNTVLRQLSGQPLGFTVPTPVASVNDELIECHDLAGGTRLLRLFTYVSGQSISTVSPTPKLITDVGASLARLNKAMAENDLMAPPRDLVWSVDHAFDLLPSISLLRAPEVSALVQRTFENFEDRVQPRLGMLRRQIIHCDFNANNVLVDPACPERVSGVIDFGDMTCGPLVQDLAVAASRHCDPRDPVPRILQVCAGYRSETPLRHEESAILFDLICLRAAMRMLHWAREAEKMGQPLDAEIERDEASMLDKLLNTNARGVIAERLAE